MTPFAPSRVIGLTAVGALVLAACGSGGDSTAPVDVASSGRPTSTLADTEPATTLPPVGRGWIDGEPDWFDESSGSEGAGSMAPTAGAAMEEAPAPDVDSAASEPREVREIDGSPLRAGSVDDNVDYDGFLTYTDRLAGLGIGARPFDVSGRIIVTVRDENARPSPGTSVQVHTDSGELVATLRTASDGSARFFPGLYGHDAAVPVVFSLAGESGEATTATSGSDVELRSPTVRLADPVPLDVLFLLDATGSMGDEIDRLKTTIDTVATRIAALEPRPDVRFAMTLYRDEGDTFVESTYDFTGDVGRFQEALAEVVAAGGGDYPEALDEGLAAALEQPAWRDPAEAVQLVFVVADAPPQVGRQVEVPYTASIVDAIERGIKIFPVASSESDDVAELVFRQLAVTTGAPFVFLSNGAAGAATGDSTDIQLTDYEELALDELVVRLVAEELGDLAGPDAPPPTVPATTAPSTTIADDQRQPTTTVTGPVVGLVVVEVIRDVDYYGACGNEVLQLGDVSWYPLLDDAVAALDVDAYATVESASIDDAAGSEPEGLLRVASPGPGDDVGTLVVYSDGIARFESDSGDIIRWMTTDPIEYVFAC